MDQDEGSSSAAEAAQQLVEVLLPMDATPTLAAHVEPHAAFVTSVSERADVILSSALFRELSQRFEKLTPLQRFSLHLSLLKHAPSEFRRRLEDSPDEWLAAVAPCVAVVVYLRRGAAIAHASSSDDLLEVLDDAELAQSRQDDAATFAASLYCVCLGLEWLGRTAYDERIANGVKRDGKILLGYDEDLTASESCVYDFAHVIGGEGFALTRAEIRTPYVVVHVTQCLQKIGVSWEAVIAHSHVLAAEVKRVKSEVHTTTPGLKAAEARARAWPARDVTHLQFEIAEAPRDGFAALACTAKLSLEDALATKTADDPLAPVHVKHVVDGRRKCHLRSCDILESDAAKFLRCARCKDAHYCSRACQEDDWRRLHHKRTCGRCPPSVDK
ncbi:unnamed protein product [Pelagomonas calceolata]|uniref:MYND-type domain-containing protein n=1 Tax=Pelagomonas calceolata TaxID=35677 RepID=A0A8J2X1F2_9STRA|nr:unnamed protein product [Pelagomonas calceolata]